MKTQIGYFASLEQYRPTDALEQAIRAEKVGFDSIWVDDHFHPWYHENAQSAQAWAWMGAALQATKNVFFSTCITCPILRYNPAIVAQTFATLRAMYPGRVGVAVGAGEAMNEVPVTGKWPSVAERQDMTVEAIEVMRKLWESKEPVTFKGKYFTLDKAFMYTKPTDEVPLYFSGLGPKGAKLAGMYGDHLMTVAAAPSVLKNVTIPKFEEGAKEAGKDPSKMEHAMLIWYSVDTDYDKAVEGNRFWAGCLVPSMFKYKVYDPKEVQLHANLVHSNTIKENYMCATNAEEMIKEIERFKDAGINHFCLGNSSPNVNAGIDIFKEIIPAVTD
ncbi:MULTISPECIES: TIGR03557 family F420-dependent LLM class oxidoreductase [unclassified Methanoculleus]|jgi:G6PDH family F420-dependent oxidoreductase|uniref:TIGR03557 family F420-dependent LLM class oxidoreductase n=5 Tax=Methanoculleus TaxID=45989 RepID=UPI00319E77A5